MHKIIVLQILAALLGALIATVLFGLSGTVSAAGGALACIVPYWLFAMALKASARSVIGPSVGLFVTGEFVKLVLIIGLLALLALLYPALHWGALLMGLVLVLNANLFALLLKT